MSDEVSVFDLNSNSISSIEKSAPEISNKQQKSKVCPTVWSSTSQLTEEQTKELHRNNLLERKGYILGKELGSGGMSTVFEVSKDGKKFAVKIVDRNNVDQNWKEKCLKQEPAIGSKLRHPHIVLTFDVLSLKNYFYTFSEFCPGGSIAFQISLKKPIDTFRIVQWFVHVTSGLMFMHDTMFELRGEAFAHRDIKPENILLTQHKVAKITDFGFVMKIADSKDRKKDSQQKGQKTEEKKEEKVTYMDITLCGTENYKAPEINGKNYYDAAKADVFSLGVTVYEMVTKRIPSKSKQQKKKGTPNRFQEVTEFPECLQELVSRMLTPNPSQRPDSREVMRHLAKFLASKEGNDLKKNWISDE